MHACLYGLAHAVIVALGCAPGLGFVHVGHECSFVYDIADLYKAEVTIPIAFEVAAQAPEDLPAVVRRRVRDAMVEHHILERMVHDIRWLLLTEEEQLFPAYAGVIPLLLFQPFLVSTFPRIRGGDPPHVFSFAVRVYLFPAYAGVIPYRIVKGCKATAFPRIRGGDPTGGKNYKPGKNFSPHTRG